MADQREQNSLLFLGRQLESINRGAALARIVQPPVGFIPVRREQLREPEDDIRISTGFTRGGEPNFPFVPPQNSLRQGFNVPQSPCPPPPQYGFRHDRRVPTRSHTVPYTGSTVLSNSTGFTPINHPLSQRVVTQGPPFQQHGYIHHQPTARQRLPEPEPEDVIRVATRIGGPSTIYQPPVEGGLTGLPSEIEYGYESSPIERGLTGLPSESEYGYGSPPTERGLTGLPSQSGYTYESRTLPPPRPLVYPTNRVMNARGELSPASVPTSPTTESQLPPLHQVLSPVAQPQNLPPTRPSSDEQKQQQQPKVKPKALSLPPTNPPVPLPTSNLPPHNCEAGQWLLYLTLNGIKPEAIHRIFTKSASVVRETPNLTALEDFIHEWKAHRFPREWLDPIFEGTRPGSASASATASHSAPPSPAYQPHDNDISISVSIAISSADDPTNTKTQIDPELIHANAIVTSILHTAHLHAWPRDLSSARSLPRFTAEERAARKKLLRSQTLFRNAASRQQVYEPIHDVEQNAKAIHLVGLRANRMERLQGEWEGREGGDMWQALLKGREGMVKALVEVWRVLEGKERVGGS